MITKKRRMLNCNRPIPGAIINFAQHVLSELATPLSLELLSALKAEKYSSVILREGINPLQYDTWTSFRTDYLATELMSKYPMDIGVDRDKVAMEKFMACEDSCEATNKRFSGSSDLKWDHSTYMAMVAMRRKIEKILGPFSWDEIAANFSFGPGATTSISRRNADLRAKLKHGVDVTAGAYLASQCALHFHSGWLSAVQEAHLVQPRVVMGSRIVTVPKNAKTSRVIAIEPDWNMFLQKGFGNVIRKRLRAAGIDLNHQQGVNRELARQGSFDNSLATIDLSSASDTISLEVVRWLLPDDWFEALSLCRSRMSLLPCGSWVNLRKFSSMGNGFTFELESLIFYALAKTVTSSLRAGGPVAVYGDDIIVPTKAYGGVKSLLDHCGFTVNTQKTFRDGPFRESCGKHYFEGQDVTPFYLRTDVSTTASLVSALNRAREWSIHPVYGLDGLKQTYASMSQKLPTWLRRPLIPYGYGDSALWGEFDESLPQKAPRGMEGWMCACLTPVLRQKMGDDRFSVLSSLWTMDKRSTATPSLQGPPRDFAGAYKKGRMLVTQWPSFGNWL